MTHVFDLPNGTVFESRGNIFVVLQGMDGKIVMEVNGCGTWQFAKGVKWECKILYKPA